MMMVKIKGETERERREWGCWILKEQKIMLQLKGNEHLELTLENIALKKELIRLKRRRN